jgi:seryl-tRNA synthetase
MLNVKWIRRHQERVQTAADYKGIKLSVADLLAWDDQRHILLQEVEGLRETRNKLSKHISTLVHNGELSQVEQTKLSVIEINTILSEVASKLVKAEKHYNDLLILVPNVVSPDTPYGRSDADNVEVRRVGIPSDRGYELIDHVALGELHDMIDIARGVKVAGTCNYYLKGVGLYRVHQFAKVEQIILCEANPEFSEALLQEIIELPYRVMAVCTGDMSQKTYKQYDIETWMPSRQAYGETHSSSNLGSIRIPEALRPYMRGQERLIPRVK